MRFSSVRSLSASVVRSAKVSSKAIWRKFVVLALEYDGGTTPILDRAYETKWIDDDEGALNSVEPLASQIAKALGVPLVLDTKRKKSWVDPIGYPYTVPLLHCRRIWRLAIDRVRRVAVWLTLATLILLLIVFVVRFQANRGEAERDFRKQQTTATTPSARIGSSYGI